MAILLLVSFLSIASEGELKRASIRGEADASIYVRSDSDKTQVITPKVHFRGSSIDQKFGIDLNYALDSWTSASVDIRSAATGTVDEIRHEVDVAIDRRQGLSTLAASYRYSHEIDYQSHTVGLFGALELQKKTTIIEVRGNYGNDTVGRSGHPEFGHSQHGISAFISLAKIFTSHTLASLAYEARLSLGYLASPYRFVAISPSPGNGTCSASATSCIPEVVPDLRLRHAAVARIRQALSRQFSMGASYRFYVDTWQLLAHTGIVDLRWLMTKKWLTSLEYRAYFQNSASFYAPHYSELTANGFYTRDRELSRLTNHYVGLHAEYRHRKKFSDFRAGARVGATRYHYFEFPGLDNVQAFDVSLTLGLSL